jgi:hypothetical protein
MGSRQASRTLGQLLQPACLPLPLRFPRLSPQPEFLEPLLRGAGLGVARQAGIVTSASAGGSKKGGGRRGRPMRHGKFLEKQVSAGLRKGAYQEGLSAR